MRTYGRPSISERIVALDGGDVALIVVAATHDVETVSETTQADCVTWTTDC